jgi:hypothetical protein
VDTGVNDLQVLLWAVQQGHLSPAQIEECLRARDEQRRREPGVGAPSLASIAVHKGFLDSQRLRDHAERAGAARPDPTILMVQVGMVCAGCGASSEVPLDRALAAPRCAQCSGSLRARKGSAAGTGRSASPAALWPEEVRVASLDPKNRFGKYILISRIGKGGMGEVFKAWDTVLQRRVAVKIPHSVGEEEIRRLYLEAQGAGRLSHPNIASVYEIAQVEEKHYIAMQYIDGTTVERRMEGMGARPDVREMVRWVRDAAAAVHYAHQNGVVHRDLKPQNLMVDSEARVYVMDFGLAKVLSVEKDATVSGMILGTPSFMPPEQASGHASEIGPTSDVYSLGATLYVLLTGKRPYEGLSVTDVLVRILTSDPPPLRQVNPALPWELEAITEKAMRREKARRYPTAQALAEDLTRFLNDQPIGARGSTMTYRVARRFRRYRAQIATAAVCLVIGGAAAAWRLVAPPPAPPPRDTRADDWRALFGKLRKALDVERVDAAAAAPLLARARAQFADQKSALDEFLEDQRKIVAAFLDNLPRSRWLESRARVAAYRDWLAFVGKDAAPAERILAYRGTCTIAIQVNPWAEVRGPIVEGLPPGERSTPLLLRDVEIRGGAIELAHPDHPARSIPLEGLEDGKSYVIEGSWEQPESIRRREGR